MRASLALAAALLVVGGCASAGKAPSPTDPPDQVTTTTTAEPTATTISPREGATRFRDCLRAEGVEIEAIPLDAQGRPRLDLVLRGVDFTREGNAAALDRCSVHLVTGALYLGDSPLIGEQVVALLDGFAECMRTRGVPDFPDPVPGFHGVGFPFPMGEIPYDDPDLPGAVEACRALLTGS